MHRGTIYLSKVPGDVDEKFYSSLYNAVGACKYHRGHKRWIIGLSRDAVAGLRKSKAPLDSKFQDWEAEQDTLAKRRKVANKIKALTHSELKTMFDKTGIRSKLELKTHQMIGCAYMIKLYALHLLMDTGTGKTATAAVAMQAFVDRLGFKRMLVIAPKSILYDSWAEDIDKFSWLNWVNISDPPRRSEITTCPLCKKTYKRHVQWRHLKTHMTKAIAEMGEEKAKTTLYERHPQLYSPAQEDKHSRLLRALKSDHQVFLINPESFKLVLDDIAEEDWDLVILDEGSILKSPKSKITEKMQLFGGMVRRRVNMTATPRPNSSQDFWGQAAFVDQSLGGNFYAFRDRYFYQGHDGYSWHAKSEEVDSLIWDNISDRAYRVKLEDCVDLPGETTERMTVDLDGVLAAHYDDMLTRMCVELESDRVDEDGNRIDSDGKIIDTEWKIVQMNKLAQITSGYVFDNDGKVEYLGESPKITATVEMATRLVEVEDRDVVIWFRYSEEARILEEKLAKFGVSTMHGKTKNKEKSAAAFKKGSNRIMIAHPLSAKFGHTWVNSDVAIFHSYDHSWEAHYQAKRRIYRMGQTKPVTYIINVAHGTVDEEILENVLRKEQASEAVVDANVFVQLLTKRRRKRRRSRQG